MKNDKPKIGIPSQLRVWNTLSLLPAPKHWLKVAIFNFLLAIIIGAMLRFAFVQEISWLHFRKFLHAHSHVAMLGWVYQALYIFFVFNFLPNNSSFRKYEVLFWITQITVFGMLITFPIFGYSSWSIAFSTTHMLLSYVFCFFFLKDVKTQTITTSLRFAKAALFFMILSTLALWAMIPIMKMQLQGQAIYYMAIQFYLHFQFNGWFIFAILALFFQYLHNNNITFTDQHIKAFMSWLIISCYLTYALAVTWAEPLPVLFYINSFGVIIQLVALIYFLLIIRGLQKELASKTPIWLKLFFGISISSFVLKILIQTAVVIPYIATVAYTIRNFAMGFLHLMLIGMVSFFLIGYGIYSKQLRLSHPLSKVGVRLFLAGFIGSELILFLQGLMFWNAWGFLPAYYELLFGVSALLPIGIFCLLLSQFLNNSNLQIK